MLATSTVISAFTMHPGHSLLGTAIMIADITYIVPGTITTTPTTAIVMAIKNTISSAKGMATGSIIGMITDNTDAMIETIIVMNETRAEAISAVIIVTK